MPSGHSQAMLDELLFHPERVFATLELDIGSPPKTFKIADEYVRSESAGMYLRRISDWGEFLRPGPDRTYHLVFAGGSAIIEDIDGVFGAELGGAGRMQLNNSPCRGYWRSNHVPAADHAKFFDGRVTNWRGGGRKYNIELGADLFALESETNNIPKLSSKDWPNAPENSWGRDGQLVCGRHRTAGLEEVRDRLGERLRSLVDHRTDVASDRVLCSDEGSKRSVGSDDRAVRSEVDETHRGRIRQYPLHPRKIVYTHDSSI